MADGRDVERVRRIITRYFEAMSEVVVRHGGTVEKFIGDAVMAVFGVPLVNEDDALRAVRAAWDMRAALPRLQETDPVGLEVRIGVNTGEVMAGDPSAGHGFVSGDAVNVAARLEQAASPGQILIGEPTYRLVAAHVEVDPVLALDLKGKEERVRAYSLVGLKTPRRAGSAGRTGSIVGRGPQLEQLNQALTEAATTRRPRWITLVGEAGSGKSTLLDHFRKGADMSATVLHGRCLPYGEGITFWPVAELVHQAAGISEPDASNAALHKLEVLTSGLQDGELVSARLSSMLRLTADVANAQEVMWAVRRMLEHLAERPLVMIVEDLHWAEPTLLDLVEYVATFTHDVPLLVLGVGRPELMERRSDWLARTRVVHLDGLTEDEVATMLQTMLGETELPTRLVEYVLEASHGNPMFVHEILKTMLEERLLERAHGRWRATAGLDDFKIPSTIQALLAARLERLPYEERVVVQHTSVVGRVFWSGAITALGAGDGDDVGSTLQALVRKELIEPQLSSFAGQDGFRFTHILMRDAAYNALPKERRGRLHEVVAEWLRDAAGDRLSEYEPVLAYHLEQAALLRIELGERDAHTLALAERAGVLLASLGRRSFAGGDLAAAVGMLKRASDLLPVQTRDRLDLQVDLSIALMESGDLQAAARLAEQALEDATAREERTSTARARLQLCALSGFLDHDRWRSEAARELEQLTHEFSSLEDELGQARAKRLLAELHWDHLRISEAENLLAQALTHARAAGNPKEEGAILSFLAAAAVWGPRPVDEAIATCEQIRDAADQNQLLRAKCLSNLGGLNAMKGHFEHARELAAEGHRLRCELGHDLAVAHGTQTRGLIEMLAGDVDAAIDEFQRGLADLEAMGEEAYLGTQAALLARALCAVGKNDEAGRFVERSRAATESDESAKAEWGPTKARLLARKGNLEEAISLAEETLRLTRAGQDVLSRGDSLTSAAEVFALAGRVDEARLHLVEALELYRAKGIKAWEDKVEKVLALTND